ncbi:MAG TPA: TlpA disulfide reductase family protein [Pyrinomonadaceae bacterium]|nr:TlpA disulfide reductase family protein [Pyrinomonadaceae bacterium]
MNSSKQSGKESTNVFWTPARMALTIIVFTLLATFGISSCNSTDKSAGANANAPQISMKVNGANAASQPANAAPPPMLPASALDFSLKTVDGKGFKLSELKGKALVIDLWATWCGPCRYEIPELVKMQSAYGPRGFEVVGLDIDPGSDTAAGVQNFIEKFNINYKVAFADKDLAISLMQGGNIPQSLVVSRDGHIVKHFIGFSPERTPAMMRDAIEQALQ